MSASLEQRYRRLLRAYPRAYRELRGDEIVSTLLDCATPGQRRPRPVEIADFLLDGLRHRLGGASSPGYAEGLRIVLPAAIVMAVLIASTVHFHFGPEPYFFAFAGTLALWALAPGLGRVAIVASTAGLLAYDAIESVRFQQSALIWFAGLVGTYAAFAAPPRSATVDDRGFGAALWHPVGRAVTLLVGGGLAALGAYGRPEWTFWFLLAGPVAFVVILAAGIPARGAARAGALWAAALLSPSLLVLEQLFLPFSYAFGDGYEATGPLLNPGGVRDVQLTLMFIAVAVLAMGMVGVLRGAEPARRGSLAFSRAALTGVAGVMVALEVAGGVPYLPVVIGCAALIAAGLGGGLLGFVPSAVLLIGGAAGVLSDVSGWLRYGQPWPLYAVALAALLTLAQTPLRRTDRRWAPGGWGVVGLVLGPIGTVALYGHYFWIEAPLLDLSEQPLKTLPVPAFVAAAAAAGLGAAVAPVRSGLTLVVAIGALLALLVPINNLAAIGGVTAVGAIAIVLIAVAASRRAATAIAPQ